MRRGAPRGAEVRPSTLRSASSRLVSSSDRCSIRTCAQVARKLSSLGGRGRSATATSRSIWCNIWVLGAGLVERGALGVGSVEGRGSACAAFSSFCRSSAVASAAAPRSRGRPPSPPSPSAAASPPASRLAAKALGEAPTARGRDLSGTCPGPVRDTPPQPEGACEARAAKGRRQPRVELLLRLALRESRRRQLLAERARLEGS